MMRLVLAESFDARLSFTNLTVAMNSGEKGKREKK